MSRLCLSAALVALMSLSVQSLAWDKHPWQRQQGQNWHPREASRWGSVDHRRAQLNRERQEMHRYYDGLMRELDERNREIDRWQQYQHRHYRDHQQISEMANRRREALNRERDRLNRERDRMNREFDEQNRQLDQQHQNASRWQHEGYYRYH